MNEDFLLTLLRLSTVLGLETGTAVATITLQPLAYDIMTNRLRSCVFHSPYGDITIDQANQTSNVASAAAQDQPTAREPKYQNMLDAADRIAKADAEAKKAFEEKLKLLEEKLKLLEANAMPNEQDTPTNPTRGSFMWLSIHRGTVLCPFLLSLDQKQKTAFCELVGHD